MSDEDNGNLFADPQKIELSMSDVVPNSNPVNAVLGKMETQVNFPIKSEESINNVTMKMPFAQTNRLDNKNDLDPSDIENIFSTAANDRDTSKTEEFDISLDSSEAVFPNQENKQEAQDALLPPPPTPLHSFDIGLPSLADLPSLTDLPKIKVLEDSEETREVTLFPQNKIPLGIRNIDAICVDIIQRTADSATLYFFVGDHGGYKAGQFISIDPKQFPELKRWCDYYEKVKGKKEAIRAYSMSSIPSEKHISITVKAVDYNSEYDDFPPLLSPFLVSGALKGREVTLRGISGPYTLADGYEKQFKTIIHCVAGSGIVPNYALIKNELQDSGKNDVKHIFIDVNKTYDDIIFKNQLDALEKTYPDNLEVIHLLTREDNPAQYGANFFKGRPTVDFLRQYITDPKECLVYACGPGITKYEKMKAKKEGYTPNNRFIESVTKMILEIGIPTKNYKFEEFG